jgi:2,4-dienoyl-CoA reductase-like NADH-dependent reductase (Old Yellow Enzyme family)
MCPRMADFPFARLGSFRDVASFVNHVASLGLELPCDAELTPGEASPIARPVSVDNLTIGNRIAVHPMEGWDATPDGRPTEATVRRWRRFGASGAKLIWGGEAVAVRHDGRANPNQLFIHDDSTRDLATLRDALVDEHRAVAGSADGLVVGLQLTHSGRYCVPNAKGRPEPWVAYRHPILDRRVGITDDSRTLSDDDVRRLIDDYVAAARVAADAGFDFVDVKHCHGYLGHEFLSAKTRSGDFGGSLENRTRFLLEVTQAVVDVAGADRVGVRFSPLGVNGPLDSDPQATFAHATQALGRFGLAYLHVIDPVDSTHRMASPDGARVAPQLRALWTGPFIVNGGYDRATGDAVIATGAADLVAFGIPFLANPDLVERFAEDAPLNTPDAKTFYSGGAAGYVDYPTRDAARTAATSDGTATGVAA